MKKIELSKSKLKKIKKEVLIDLIVKMVILLLFVIACLFFAAIGNFQLTVISSILVICTFIYYLFQYVCEKLDLIQDLLVDLVYDYIDENEENNK